MQFPIHARPSDEVGQLATVTLATGSEDPDNPLSNLTTMDPAAIFLTSSSGTAVDVVWDSLIATDVKVFSLHHHNIPAGTNVRIQRNATNTWGAPTIDAAVPITTYPQTGLPFPVGVDLTEAAGYTVSGFRYTRLHIPSLAQLVGLGSALLWGEKRTDWDPHLPPSRHAEQQPATMFKTALGRRRGYWKGVRLRTWPIAMRQEDPGWQAFITLFRECSCVEPFLWWPDPTHDSDARLVGLASDAILEERPIEDPSLTIHDFDAVLEELGCGVAIPTELVT
jgi:hypothetical protein